MVQPVASGDPVIAVIGDPDLSVGVLPGERPHWQVDTSGLTVLHQGSRPGVAEQEMLGRPQLGANLFGIAYSSVATAVPGPLSTRPCDASAKALCAGRELTFPRD